MHEGLAKAKQLASAIRYSEDARSRNSRPSIDAAGVIRGDLYRNELLISPQVTPSLHRSLLRVLERLQIPEGAVEAFVYASPEINAQCFGGYGSRCVVRFSSALIDVLSSEEFEFVVGHELAHFLFEHSPNETSDGSLEGFMKKRAQEVSADRIGLIACDDVATAIRALIKTVSGLGDKHLRYDVAAFVGQLRKSETSIGKEDGSSHPPILVRARALLWFSSSNACQSYLEQQNLAGLLAMDARIRDDFDQYVDGEAKKRIAEARTNVQMWRFVLRIIEDGLFSKDAQLEFSDQFGEDSLQSMKRFIDGASLNEVSKMVSDMLVKAEDELASVNPSYFDEAAD